MSDTIDAYAAALLAVLRAEGDTGADDEILRFAQALEANDELRNTLADPHVPAATRQQIVEDLLQGKASDVTTAAVSLVVGAGRAGDFPAIARALVVKLATASGRDVAEVITAGPVPTRRCRVTPPFGAAPPPPASAAQQLLDAVQQAKGEQGAVEKRVEGLLVGRLR